MPIDLNSLTKVETMPPSSQAQELSPDTKLLVIVQLHEGQSCPPALHPRAGFGEQIFTAEIRFSDLEALQKDPAIKSMAVSRLQPSTEEKAT